MRLGNLRLFSSALFALSIAVALPFISTGHEAAAQGNNSISGQVFGIDRRSVADVFVELLDDVSRTIARDRTDHSGRFMFRGLSAGRFTIRVKPFGTDYEEQEQSVEIVVFARGSGSARSLGSTNEQKDIYLRLRQGITPETMTGAVFVQNVPDDARKHYEKGLALLTEKKEKEAYEELKASLEVFPKYFAALELLANEYVKKGFYDASTVLYTIAVDVNPRAYKSWYGLGYSQYALKNYSEAQKSVNKAVEINPYAPDPVFLSGSLMRHNKNYTEAEKLLIKARQLSGDSMPDIHWELALVYANGLKRYGDAAKELRLFLKARPDSKDAENIKKLIAQFEEKAKAG